MPDAFSCIPTVAWLISCRNWFSSLSAVWWRKPPKRCILYTYTWWENELHNQPQRRPMVMRVMEMMTYNYPQLTPFVPTTRLIKRMSYNQPQRTSFVTTTRLMNRMTKTQPQRTSLVTRVMMIMTYNYPQLTSLVTTTRLTQRAKSELLWIYGERMSEWATKNLNNYSPHDGEWQKSTSTIVVRRSSFVVHHCYYSPHEVVLLHRLVSTLRNIEISQGVPDEGLVGPLLVPVVLEEHRRRRSDRSIQFVQQATASKSQSYFSPVL